MGRTYGDKPISGLVLRFDDDNTESLRIECFNRDAKTVTGKRGAEISFKESDEYEVVYYKDDLIKIARYLLNEASKL